MGEHLPEWTLGHTWLALCWAAQRPQDTIYPLHQIQWKHMEVMLNHNNITSHHRVQLKKAELSEYAYMD